MAKIAVEVIKIKQDSNSSEVVYEPNTNFSIMVAGVFVETAKFKDTDTGQEQVIEAGKHTTDV